MGSTSSGPQVRGYLAAFERVAILGLNRRGHPATQPMVSTAGRLPNRLSTASCVVSMSPS